MTAIVAIADGPVVLMGADSAHVSGWDLTLDTAPKVFMAGPFLIGLSGYPRMSQIIRYRFQPPEPGPGADLRAFMCTTFADALREALKDAGWAKKDNERESAEGSTFLAAISGRIFKVWENYQVGERTDGFDACGCGEDYALGALFATEGMDRSPRWRLNVALAAAASGSAGVRSPFVIISTPEAGS